MTVRYSKGVLRLHNEGADMDRKALLIGHTTKVGMGLRGQFGEGLDLAFLAGVRAGLKIVVETRTERWEPTIAYSEEFGANCLSVQTRARKVAGSGVTVLVEISEERWEECRNKFIFLSDIPDDQIVRIPEKGSILLQAERKGHVYVRGIFVDCLPKLSCGYDLEGVKLDRDRRMIDVWDLQWRLGAMYQDAVSRRPEAIAPQLYKMLRDGAEDTQHLHYHSSPGTIDVMAESFRSEHGQNAVPVSSIAEAVELEHFGRRGVVVEEGLRKTLEKGNLNVAAIKSQLKNEVVRSVAWSDLSDVQKNLLSEAATLLDTVCPETAPILSKVNIVEFCDPLIQGLFTGSNGRIDLALRLLDSPKDTLCTLVHETAHALSSDGDGGKGHVQTIEDLWARLYFAKP
jgi:hypothetical protein